MSGLTHPYSRYTQRLFNFLREITVALGGEGGARILTHFHLGCSADTLLRILKGASLPKGGKVRFVGVDDFAFRKGHTYGSILVDLERNRVIDLLPDRKAETLANWLKTHPGVELISRDRAGAYAQGAREGAPHARQVTDRWHLIKNLGAALQRWLTREPDLFHVIKRELGPEQTVSLSKNSTTKPVVDPAKMARFHIKRERYHQVQSLYREGLSIRAISRRVGLDRKTARKYVKTPLPQPNRSPRRKKLVPYEAYLRERWQAGFTQVSILFKELQNRGYQGSHRTLRRYLAQWKKDPQASKQAPRRPFSIRHLSFLLTQPMEKLENKQQQFFSQLLESNIQLRQAAELSRSFVEVLCQKKCLKEWKSWLAEVANCPIRELKNFAAGLQKDQDAVEAAITLDWSNGQVEGQVNKLKVIKRQMYGRAKFELLRKRVLLAA